MGRQPGKEIKMKVFKRIIAIIIMALISPLICGTIGYISQSPFIEWFLFGLFLDCIAALAVSVGLLMVWVWDQFDDND